MQEENKDEEIFNPDLISKYRFYLDCPHCTSKNDISSKISLSDMGKHLHRFTHRETSKEEWVKKMPTP
jgi:hypothetical protein